MTFGRYDNNSEFVIFQQYQMASAGNTPTTEIDIYDWQKKFWEITSNWKGEVPMPIMVGKDPYWRGVDPGHYDLDEKARLEGKVFVGGFDLKTYRVSERSVRIPNDEEYEKFFKAVIDKGTYYLKKHGGGYVMARRWVDMGKKTNGKS